MPGNTTDTLSIIFALLLIPVILFFIGWFIKIRFIDKRWPSSGTQNVTRVIYSEFETREHREATSEMNFAEEDERDEDHGGEDPIPGKKP